MSCGDPAADADALMQRKCSAMSSAGVSDSRISSGRKKYDKTKICVKCKIAQGNLVIRHAVYCKFVLHRVHIYMQKLIYCVTETASSLL